MRKKRKENVAIGMKYDLSLLPRRLTSYPGLSSITVEYPNLSGFQVLKVLTKELSKNEVELLLSGWGTCYTHMRMWIQIPSTHVKC